MVELHNEMYQPNTQTISGGMLGRGGFVGVWPDEFYHETNDFGPCGAQGSFVRSELALTELYMADERSVGSNVRSYFTGSCRVVLGVVRVVR